MQYGRVYNCIHERRWAIRKGYCYIGVYRTRGEADNKLNEIVNNLSKKNKVI